MKPSTRPTLENLMKSLNSERWPERWNDIYDSIMDDYEANGCELLDPDFYDTIAQKYNILDEFLEDYKRVASEVAKDDALSRLLVLMAASMRDRKNIKADIKQLALPQSDDGSYVEKYAMLPALSMCATVEYTYNLIKDKNLPEEHLLYAMRRCDGTGMIRNYRLRNDGRLGAMDWSWFQLGVDAKLFKPGILVIEFGRKFIPEATVFMSNDGEIVTMAHSALFHKDGYVLGTKNYEDEDEAFEPTLVETDDAWIGCAYDDRGLVRKEKIVLPKSEWKLLVAPGDPIIDIHIPSGAKITDEAVSASFGEIREFIAKYFPEIEYKALVCKSWMLDPQLADMLKPESNIVKFGKRYTRLASKSEGMSVLSFVFLQSDVKNVDLNALPENTSLERALKQHYLDGKKIYDTYGYILK